MKETPKRILARLRNAEGHLRGIQDMIEKDAYCIDVLRQTRAVQAALNRVNALVLERHLNHCVTRAFRSPARQERERVIAELVELLGGEGKG